MGLYVISLAMSLAVWEKPQMRVFHMAVGHHMAVGQFQFQSSSYALFTPAQLAQCKSPKC